MPSTKYVNSVTSSVTASPDFDVYNIDATNNSITITMPEVSSLGVEYTMKRIDSVSANTVTIASSDNLTIDGQSSITLRPNGSVNIVSSSTGWTSNGGNANSLIGPQSEYNLSFGSGGTPRVLIFSTTPQVIQYFIYQGSNFYMTNPVVMIIGFSLNSGTTNVPFSVTLTNTANSQQIAQINATATTSSTTLLMASTNTFSNVPTGQSLIQISGNLMSTGTASVQLYCMYLQFA
jgi:hypothetical protein